jgi:hypothetical protein
VEVEETIEHVVTKEEIEANGLQEVLEPGDTIEIPTEEEVAIEEEAVIETPKKKGKK